jgi:hypothetical protein
LWQGGGKHPQAGSGGHGILAEEPKAEGPFSCFEGRALCRELVLSSQDGSLLVLPVASRSKKTPRMYHISKGTTGSSSTKQAGQQPGDRRNETFNSNLKAGLWRKS